MAEFPIVPNKTAMLFFDTLNVYLHPEDPKSRAAIDASGVIDRMAKMNRACRDAGIAVFYGQADHRPDGKDFARQVVARGHGGQPGQPPIRTSFGHGVVAGTPGAEVIPEIAPQPGDYIIKKHRWSTFFQTHLDLSLRTAGIDTIMIAGGSIEVGVASTAYSARDLDYNLVILGDVCTSRDPSVTEFFLDKVFPIFARVMTVDEAIATIEP
jgi:nicotinamidase-related amidase